MRDHAVQGAAPVKGIQADPRPAAHHHLAPVGHVGRIGGKHQVNLDGNVRVQVLRRNHRTAQVEFLLHRPDQMQGGPRAALTSARKVQQRRTARTVIDRGACDALSRQFDHTGGVNHGGADANARSLDRGFAAMARVDANFGRGQNFVLFVWRGGMVGLVHDDARDVALSAAKGHLLRGHRAFADAAHAFDPDQAIRFDLADKKAQLIHMGEDHHRGLGRITRNRGDQIAQTVGAVGQAQGVQLAAQPSRHTFFMARQARNGHQGL